MLFSWSLLAAGLLKFWESGHCLVCCLWDWPPRSVQLPPPRRTYWVCISGCGWQGAAAAAALHCLALPCSGLHWTAVPGTACTGRTVAILNLAASNYKNSKIKINFMHPPLRFHRPGLYYSLPMQPGWLQGSIGPV